jgi:DNA-directed RNA polymerase subunit RPC12/RpoP
METTTITNDSNDVHIQCPHCKNCESHPIDEQRNHIQSFEILEWNEVKSEDEPEISVMRCIPCKTEFKLIWKYAELYSYSISTNTIWTSFDYGTVYATSFEEARELALEKLKYDFEKVNHVLAWADITSKFSIHFNEKDLTIKKGEA